MGSLLLVLQKICTPRSLKLGLSHPGRIRIDTHQSNACRRGWPRSLIWSVCTHRSRLPTVVASGQFVSVWASVEIRAFLFCESILSFLPGECVTTCLHDLLEFRRAYCVPRFAYLLAFILIAISVSSEFQQSISAALRLDKVPLGSFPHWAISKKTARSCHTKQVQNSYATTVCVQDIPCGRTILHKFWLVDYILGMGKIWIGLWTHIIIQLVKGTRLLHRHEGLEVLKSPLDVEGVRAVQPVLCKTDEAFHQRCVVIHTWSLCTKPAASFRAGLREANAES